MKKLILIVLLMSTIIAGIIATYYNRTSYYEKQKETIELRKAQDSINHRIDSIMDLAYGD